MLARGGCPCRRPACAFRRAGDIATLDRRLGDLDLVFSNAALQWVPDHVGVVTGGGRRCGRAAQLAVQIPTNADHSLAPRRRRRWRAASRSARRWRRRRLTTVATNVLDPVQYAILLDHLGGVRASTCGCRSTATCWPASGRRRRVGQEHDADAVPAASCPPSSSSEFVDHVPPTTAARTSATRRRTSTRSGASCSGPQACQNQKGGRREERA